LNAVRFVTSVAGTVAVWTVLACGGGLWALVASAAVRLLGELWLTRKQYGPFFAQLHGVTSSDASWSRDVLPMQWRVAIQGILLWFVNGVPGLVVFRWHGDVAAGRLGMTWTVLTALQSASLAWLETRRPQFGSLIAERRFAELDQLFFASLKRAVTILLVAGGSFVLAVWWMSTREEWLWIRLAGSMLPWRTAMLFTVAFVLLQLALGASLYVRAHKRDPFLVASVISGSVLASLEFWWGRKFGPDGVAAAYLLGVSCVQVPLWLTIWRSARREWHKHAEPAEPRES
jgi:hypothetical protein